MKHVPLLAALILLHGCAYVAISPVAEGRVTNVNGEPLKALVVIHNNQLPEKSQSTTCSSDGNYAVGPIRTWTPVPFSAIKLSSTISISAPGYKAASFEANSHGVVTTNVILEAQ